MIRIQPIPLKYADPRRLALVALVAGTACAHVEPPRGGPEDLIPPEVVVTRPEADAIVPRYDGPVVFLFDERISERGVEEAVMVSPRTSPIEVRSGRDQVRVSLRRGWEPDRIYHVTLRQEISDLFGNRLAEPVTLVFSTGPEIPATEASGVVLDRITGRPAAHVRVEAIRSADSLVYAVPTDANGHFQLTRFPEGEYQIRAFEDVNRNRSLEYFEPRDSAYAEVRIGEGVEVSLRLLLPDSTPPIARTGTIRQREIRVEFDDYLDPEQELDPLQVAVLDPAGTPLSIASVSTGTMPPPAPPARPTPAPLGPPGIGAPQPAADPPPPPAIVGPLPERTLLIELDEEVELEPETEYRVTVQGVLNVNGLAGDAEVTVTTPDAPAAPAPPATVPPAAGPDPDAPPAPDAQAPDPPSPDAPPAPDAPAPPGGPGGPGGPAPDQPGPDPPAPDAPAPAGPGP